MVRIGLPLRMQLLGVMVRRNRFSYYTTHNIYYYSYPLQPRS